MIIWGWRTVFRVIGSGVFSCPTCGADRNYQRRKAQRFFTLFFIPLIPLKTIGEFIRCTYCKNDFRDSVLSRPTAAQFTDLLQNTVRGVMVNVLRRGGWDHPAARAAAVQEITTAGAIGYAEPNLAQDMQVVPADLSQMLASLAGQLPDAGREALVTGATRVAAADGPVQPAERAVIDTVGAGLGMSQAHVAGIVASVTPAAPAGATGAQAAAGQAPAWGTGQAPAWGSGAQAPAAGGSGMETVVIKAPQPAPAAGGSGMETMLIQAPQPAPATGAQDAVPPRTPPASGSGMETVLIPAPPATLVDTSSAMETMAIPLSQVSQPRPAEPADPADHAGHADAPTHVTRVDDQGPAGWQSQPPRQQ